MSIPSVKGDRMEPEGYVVLTCQFQKEGRRWLARCEELGTSVFGRSLPEADRILNEAIWLHLNTLEDVGERERFFKEHNIHFHNVKPKHDIRVSIPLRQDVFIHPHVQRIPTLRLS